MQIGERLFSLRKEAQQTLQEVADAIGVSKAHVWELEKGHSTNPSHALVRRLAAHFGVQAEVLTGEAEAPASSDRQIQRIYRDLKDLSPRDRTIIEQMVRSMQPARTPGA